MTRTARRWFGAGFGVLALVWLLILKLIGRQGERVDSVVGAWLVTAPEAPFPYHVFTFHQDGTMSQANPDAGNQHTSDSDGAGTWTCHGTTVDGVFAEVTADRDTGAPVGTGRISFTLTVTGDHLAGRASADFYDTAGAHVRGPLITPLSGLRIRLVSNRLN